MKDDHDIHFARCRACCKSIKLQTMGEAALTSHAGGAGHKAALRKLMEGSTNSKLKREWRKCKVLLGCFMSTCYAVIVG